MSTRNAGVSPRRLVHEGAVTTPFSHILCGVDGTRTANEAVRQAAVLAAGRASLSLVAVAWPEGGESHEVAPLSPHYAERAVAKAATIARKQGTEPTVAVERAKHPADVFLERAPEHDLLVLGRPTFPRAGGIILGGLASTAVHSADVPVLLARPAPGRVAFPKRILLASDGSVESRRLVELGVRIAEAHDARVTLLHVSSSRPARPRAIAEQATQLYEWLEIEPVLRSEPGRAHAHIVEVAEREQSSLVVVGSRGLTGVRALASVSERVAHHARCSVLVVRPPGP